MASNANRSVEDISKSAAQVQQQGDNTQGRNVEKPDAVSEISNSLDGAQNEVSRSIRQADQAIAEAQASIQNFLDDNIHQCIQAFLASLSCPVLKSLKLLFQSLVHLFSLRIDAAFLQMSSIRSVIEGYRSQLALIRLAIQDPQEVVFKLLAERNPESVQLLYECVDLATLFDSIKNVDFIARALKFIDQLSSKIGRLSYQLDRLNYASQILNILKSKLNKIIAYIDFLCIGFTNSPAKSQTQSQLKVGQTSQEAAAAVKQILSDFEKELGKQLDNSTVTLADILLLTEREIASGDGLTTSIQEVPDRITLAVEKILAGETADVQTSMFQTGEGQTPLVPGLDSPVVQVFVAPDGSITQVLADGTIITKSGTTISARLSDGTTITIVPGKKTTVSPDGSVEEIYSNKTVTIYPDGTVITVYADGRTVTTRANGNVETQDFRGNLTVVNSSFSAFPIQYGPDMIASPELFTILRSIVLPYDWSFVATNGLDEDVNVDDTFVLTDSDGTTLSISESGAFGVITQTNGYSEELPVRFYELRLAPSIYYETHLNASCDTSVSLFPTDFPLLGGPVIEDSVVSSLPPVGAKHGPPPIGDACVLESVLLENSNSNFLARTTLADGTLITQKKIDEATTIRYDQSLADVVYNFRTAHYFETQIDNGVLTQIIKEDQSITINEVTPDSTTQTTVLPNGLTTVTSGTIISGFVVSGSISGFTSYPHGLSVMARYEEARDLARGWSDDAFLVYAQTNITLRRNGLFDTIAYEFYSNRITKSRVILVTASSITDLGLSEPTVTEEIYDVNFDSWKAMPIADDNGALNFRLNNSDDYNVQAVMFGAASMIALTPNETIKKYPCLAIIYRGIHLFDGTLTIGINANTGEIIDLTTALPEIQNSIAIGDVWINTVDTGPELQNT